MPDADPLHPEMPGPGADAQTVGRQMTDHEFQIEVVDRLARIEEALSTTCKAVDSVQTGLSALDKRSDGHDLELREMKVKSGIFGAAAGALLTVAVALIRKALGV